MFEKRRLDSFPRRGPCRPSSHDVRDCAWVSLGGDGDFSLDVHWKSSDLAFRFDYHGYLIPIFENASENATLAIQLANLVVNWISLRL